MTKQKKGTFKVELQEDSISYIDIDFKQNGSWFHVDSDNNKNTQNKDTNSSYVYTLSGQKNIYNFN